MITKALIIDAYNMQWVNSASAAIAALVVAKAILIIDMTPIGRMFQSSKVVYHIIWKTFVYSILVSVFRYAEELIPLWSKVGPFGEANQTLADEFSLPHSVAL